MAENRNQHYVPQHYLRQFCVEGTRLISVLRIDPFLFIPRAPIKGQCQEANFYSTDGQLDDLLRLTEEAVAPVLTEVCRTQECDTKQEYALKWLGVVLHLRSKKTVERQKEFPRYMYQMVIEDAIARGELPPAPADWKVEVGGAAGNLYKTAAIPCFFETATLAFKLLRAAPETHFLTSDSPPILLNQYLRGVEPRRSFVGFGSSGFQLVLPISPLLCAFVYDRNIYRVGDRKKRVVDISKDDVDIINSLVLQTASKCVYSHNPLWEAGSKELLRRYGGLRNRDTACLKVYPTDDEKKAFLHVRSLSPLFPKLWQFCTLVRHPRPGRGMVRHPAWTFMVQKLAEDIENNPSKEGVFERLFRMIDEIPPG